MTSFIGLVETADVDEIKKEICVVRPVKVDAIDIALHGGV